MIIFHAKRDGTVTTEPSFLPHGSSMADLIVFSEFDYAFCTIKLMPASGLYIPDVVCDFVLKADKTTVWTASLPPEVAKAAGTVTYQLIFTAADGTQQGTLCGSFTVPRGAITNMPDSVGDLDKKTVSDVYTLLSNIYASFTGHESEITRLLSMLTVSGKVTIPATDWTDITPYLAIISIGDVLSAGDLILVAPADDATKAIAEASRLSMVVGGTIDSTKDYVVFARAEGSEAPAEPMSFRYTVIRTGSDDPALVALIGVDAYGSGSDEGSGGVDEEAVRALIRSTVPAWAQSETPPADAVQSVNGQTGAVSLTAADVGARSSTWTPTAEDVGADPSGTAASKVSAHNTETAAHNDIRLLIQSLSDRLTALASLLNSDDITLDETKEIVAYIKSNRSLIDSITASKVNVTDIINDLVTNVDNKPLSAAQGVALKALIDTLTTTVAGKATTEQVTAAVNAALEQAKESGEFDGAPYTLTAEDKAEIVQAILAELGAAVIGYVDENNNIVVEGALADGEYTVAYLIKNADGTTETVSIGSLVLGEDETEEPEPDEPTPTNFADLSDAYWQVGYRLATAYGYGKPCDGHILTNFIPAQKDDVIYVTGLNLSGYANSHPAYVGCFTAASISETDTTNYTKTCAATGVAGGSSDSGAKNSVTVTTDDSNNTTTYAYTILMMDGTDGSANFRNAALDTIAYIRISAPVVDGYKTGADDTTNTRNIVINVKRNGVWL